MSKELSLDVDPLKVTTVRLSALGNPGAKVAPALVMLTRAPYPLEAPVLTPGRENTGTPAWLANAVQCVTSIPKFTR